MSGYTNYLGARRCCEKNLVGPKGSDGVQGPGGPIGPAGVIGYTGATGQRGPTGCRGPTGAQGAGGPGATGATGAQGATGAISVAGAGGTGSEVQAPASTNGPAIYTNTMQNSIPATNFDIGIPILGIHSYLPGGDWRTTSSQLNHLPISCKGFVFLAVNADMTSVNGNPNETVYVPCYFQNP